MCFSWEKEWFEVQEYYVSLQKVEVMLWNNC